MSAPCKSSKRLCAQVLSRIVTPIQHKHTHTTKMLTRHEFTHIGFFRQQTTADSGDSSKLLTVEIWFIHRQVFVVQQHL